MAADFHLEDAEEDFEAQMHDAALDAAATRIANGELISRPDAVAQEKEKQALQETYAADPGVAIKDGEGNVVDYTLPELQENVTAVHYAKKMAILQELREQFPVE